LALVIWAMASTAPVWTVSAADFPAQVVRIKDGDTIVVLHDNKQIDIRLEGIDSPESGQAFSQKAKQATSQLVFGKTVTIQPTGTDKYGRTLANVLLPDGRSLNEELVRQGYAWWFRKYSKDQTLAKLEADARQSRRGLWADPKPIPPWDWRDQQRTPAKTPLSEVPTVPNGVEIAGLLPNPDGQDERNEQVSIRNGTNRDVDLAGWKLLDRAGNKFQLSGKVAAGRAVTIRLDPPTMPLNNDGDEVLLLDANGVPVSRVGYTERQIRTGEWIEFGVPIK